MSTFFSVSEKVQSASEKALKEAKPAFRQIEEITEYNQQKVLAAFIRSRVDEADF